VFDQIWKRITGEEEAPKATDANRGWREVLLAAAAQGVSSPWLGRPPTAAVLRRSAG
jgi:hypothetical protein